MAITEGINGEAPQDSAGRRMLGLYLPGVTSGSGQFYLPLADGGHNLRVAAWDASGQPFYTTANPAHTREVGSNIIAFDSFATYTALDAINTVKNINIALPTVLSGQALYQVTIFNASTDSQISGSMQVVETFNSVAKYSTLQHASNPLVVPANSTRTWLIQGWLLGESFRLAVTNATAIEATDANVYLRIRRA